MNSLAPASPTPVPPAPLSLSERMAAIKAAANTSTTSELVTVPTHLYVLLELYNKARTECYPDYMEGFKVLLDWLCPTAAQLQVPTDIDLKVPPLANGYEQNQVANIIATRLVGKPTNSKKLIPYLAAMRAVDTAVFIYCAKSIPRDYLV